VPFAALRHIAHHGSANTRRTGGGGTGGGGGAAARRSATHDGAATSSSLSESVPRPSAACATVRVGALSLRMSSPPAMLSDSEGRPSHAAQKASSVAAVVSALAQRRNGAVEGAAARFS
jgi:hypothetical protein